MGIAIVVAFAGCGGGDSDETASVVQLDSVPGLGQVLANSSGKTLYRSSNDVRGSGLTHCNGACAKIWQPELTATEPVPGPGIEALKLGTITRRDGSVQATYDGWPLYSYTREGPRGSLGVGLPSGGNTWYALEGAKAVSIQDK